MIPANIPVVPLSAVTDPVTQNMSGAAFDQVANEARSRVQDAASAGQFGSMVLENLRGYFERASHFADRLPPQQQSRTTGPVPAQDVSGAKGGVQPAQIDQVIASLGTIFNYSIETQLVVRGGTQVSGAANTLLRGQ